MDYLFRGYTFTLLVELCRKCFWVKKMASFAAMECFLPLQQSFLAPTHYRQGNGTSSTVVFLPRAASTPHHSKSLSFSFSSQGTFILSAKIPYFTFLRNLSLFQLNQSRRNKFLHCYWEEGPIVLCTNSRRSVSDGFRHPNSGSSICCGELVTHINLSHKLFGFHELGYKMAERFIQVCLVWFLFWLH